MTKLIYCSVAPTARSYEPCGTYVIPYPLTTGPKYGDPMYNNFFCDKSTGKVSFKMSGGKSYPLVSKMSRGKSYPVTWIDEVNVMFYIETDYFYSFNSSFNNQNSTDFPFNVTEYDEGALIKINWLPAPEPWCSKPIDCMKWPYSTCRATREGGIRCQCDSNYNWNDTIVDAP